MRQLLNDCQKIELLANSIYQHLSADQGYAGTVRKTFRDLAADELDHSRQIDAFMELQEGTLDIGSRIAGEKIEAALNLARRMDQDVRGRRYSEEDALRLAIRVEEAFVRFHLDNALHFYNRREAEIFQGLARSDEAHLNTLRECLSWSHRRKEGKEGGA